MKKIKITTIILAIILITLVAFGGVYIKTQNRMENKVKGYQFGRDIAGGRVVYLKLTSGDEETTKNNEEDLTIENYEITKKTVETRLKNLGVEDYTISLNKEDGTIIVELPENDYTDNNVYYLIASGKVKINEKDTETELLSDSMVKKAKYSYSANAESEYQAYLELQLTEEGQAKIEEIQNNYAILSNEVEAIEEKEENTESEETETSENNEENTENVETETETEETKKIATLKIADTEYDVEKIEKNKITVKIGSATTNATSANNYIAKAAELTMLINSGKYPINYEVDNNRFVYSDITETMLIYSALVVLAIILVIFAIMIIKYKVNGLLVDFAIVGFISIMLLVLRYTNVIISIEGIGAIILTLAINFKINQTILRKIKENNDVNEAVKFAHKDIYLKLVPVIIISLVFCFSGLSNLASFGMIMFWGFALIAIYNFTVTKALLRLKESK